MKAPSSALPRKLVGAAIVAFWLVMVGLLAWREIRARRATLPADAAVILAPADTWLGLFFEGDHPVGTVHLTTRREWRQGVVGTTLRLDGHIQLRMLGTPAELALDGWLWRATREPRAEFDAAITSSQGPLRAVGHVYNDELRARITSGGQTFPVTLPVGRSLFAPDLLALRLPVTGLRPGQETTLDALDPMSGRPTQVRLACQREETVRVGGAPVHARVLAASTPHGTITAWVAENGEVIKADTPWGLSVRRISPAEAVMLRRGDQEPELTAALLVVPTGKRPFRGARRMVVRVGGLPPSRPLPTDDTQRPGPETRPLVIAPVQPLSGGARDATRDDLAAALECDALIQCDHPKIRAQAAEIIGDERDPWRRAVRIERWVNASLAKRGVLSLGSALDVLAHREGDCTEHTALFTALARAAGIPTRQIAGLVWSDELQAFGYHAWPEVFVGRWVWVDPTLGQEIADATHIRLTMPDTVGFEEVLDALGRLKVEVVEVE